MAIYQVTDTPKKLKSVKKSVGGTQRRGNETNKSDGLYTTRWDTKCDKGTIGTSRANFLGRKGHHTPRSRLTLRQRERTTTPRKYFVRRPVKVLLHLQHVPSSILYNIIIHHNRGNRGPCCAHSLPFTTLNNHYHSTHTKTTLDQ
jgi:hypothetical protein